MLRKEETDELTDEQVSFIFLVILVFVFSILVIILD
jgi:hypothetical protein